MNKSYKLIFIKKDKKIKIQYYTQCYIIVTTTKYHPTKPIYQIEVEMRQIDTMNNNIITCFYSISNTIYIFPELFFNIRTWDRSEIHA